MRRAGESLQLALLLRVLAPIGAARTLRVLVDTGAQINLVKHDLFDMKPVRRKLRFASVNGSTCEEFLASFRGPSVFTNTKRM